jgi:DNA-binding PadR family transcriptional regulator
VWVKGQTLPIGRLAASLQKKGWIEIQFQGPKHEAFYRITDVGLAALKAPVPVQKSWAKLQSTRELGLKAKK